MIRDKIIGYDPYDPTLLNPASIDMRLHHLIRRPMRTLYGTPIPPEIDTAEVPSEHTSVFNIASTGGYVIKPGEFILASTMERVTLPDDIVSRVEGKSSLGRIGLAVHITAGFIDPGFSGQVTLEIANLSPWNIVLHAQQRIAQMAFMVMDSPARAPYQSTGHYQDQVGPTESRYKIR